MINALVDWYRSTPLLWRRLIVTILVPVNEYIFVVPCRWGLNAAAKINPNIAIALLPVLLVVGVLTAATCCLFIIEMLPGVVNKIHNPTLRTAGYVGMLAWVIVPFHLIS